MAIIKFITERIVGKGSIDNIIYGNLYLKQCNNELVNTYCEMVNNKVINITGGCSEHLNKVWIYDKLKAHEHSMSNILIEEMDNDLILKCEECGETLVSLIKDYGINF